MYQKNLTPVQALAQSLGISADGCRTKGDVSARSAFLREIAKGWDTRKPLLINPYRVLGG